MATPKIALVVGHTKNGKDRGAVSPYLNISENDWNTEIAKDIRNNILPEFVELFYYPTDIGENYNTYGKRVRDLNQRLKKEEQRQGVKYVAVIELHYNMAGETTTGFEALYWHTSTKGKEMANIYLNNMKDKFLLLRNRGAVGIKSVNERGGGSLRYLDQPTILVEPFFGSNPSDTIMFKDTTNYKEVLVKTLKAIYEKFK